MHDNSDIPYGYCHCGCGEKTNIAIGDDKRDGQKKGEPYKYLAGHRKRKSGSEYVAEDRGYETPCWIWQLSIASNGYGNLRSNGTCRSAHRVIYEREVGSIPKGLDLDHLCRVRECVNPDHLEPVTRGENLRRMYAAGGRKRAGAAAEAATPSQPNSD